MGYEAQVCRWGMDQTEARYHENILAAVPKEQREARGFTDSLTRLSVGIEDGDDLIADLEAAISAAREGPAGGAGRNLRRSRKETVGTRGAVT